MTQPRPALRFASPWQSPFPLSEKFLPPLLLAIVVESLLYGMHTIIFFLCVRVLLQQKRRLRMIMLVAVVIMFMLATADLAITWNIILQHTQILYSGDSSKLLTAIYPKFIIFLINNTLADCLLVIRCYVVWGNKKIILYTAGLLVIVGTVFGVIGEGTTSPSLKKFIAVYILIVLVLNIVVTILTAGRILWIAREVRLIMGSKMVSHYHFAVGILVESGVIYTASTLLVLSLSRTNLILMAATIAIRVVCIVPILIIVQVALGQSTKDVQGTVSMMQGGTPQEVVLDTIVSDGRYDIEEQATTHERPDHGAPEAAESSGNRTPPPRQHANVSV